MHTNALKLLFLYNILYSIRSAYVLMVINFHCFRPGQLRNQHGKERSQFFCRKSHFRTLARCLDSRVLMHEHHYMLVQVHVKHIAQSIYFIAV